MEEPGNEARAFLEVRIWREGEREGEEERGRKGRRAQLTYYSGKSLSWMSPRVVCSVAELLIRELPEDCTDNTCMHISL